MNHPTTDDGNAKIMVIVEDELDLRGLLSGFFRKRGWVVHEYGTVMAGIDGVFEHEPKVLFLDNNLPDGMGWEAAPQLACNFPKMIIHLISGYHPAPPEMPADSYFQVLEKPLSFSQFDQLYLG